MDLGQIETFPLYACANVYWKLIFFFKFVPRIHKTFVMQSEFTCLLCNVLSFSQGLGEIYTQASDGQVISLWPPVKN